MKKYITATVILLTVIIIAAAVIIGITGAGDKNGVSSAASESTSVTSATSASTSSPEKPVPHEHSFDTNLACVCGETLDIDEYFSFRENTYNTYMITSCKRTYSRMVLR